MNDPTDPTTEELLDEGSQRIEESQALLRELDRQLDEHNLSEGRDEVPEQPESRRA